jgi:hypothetical protein
MEHSLEKLLVIVALGAATASPAFARSELNGHQQRFVRSELNGHQQRSPRDANMFIANDGNLARAFCVIPHLGLEQIASASTASPRPLQSCWRAFCGGLQGAGARSARTPAGRAAGRARDRSRRDRAPGRPTNSRPVRRDVAQGILDLARITAPTPGSHRRRDPGFRTAPAKNPRTECCCHPVYPMIAAIVVPCGPFANHRGRCD